MPDTQKKPYPARSRQFELGRGGKLEELRIQYAQLQQKYDALNAKFNLNQPKADAEQAAAMQSILTSQAMGMGAVFRK